MAAFKEYEKEIKIWQNAKYCLNEILLDRIDDSYTLVVSKLTKKEKSILALKT